MASLLHVSVIFSRCHIIRQKISCAIWARYFFGSFVELLRRESVWTVIGACNFFLSVRRACTFSCMRRLSHGHGFFCQIPLGIGYAFAGSVARSIVSEIHQIFLLVQWHSSS
jgi:hypothetical protein